MADTSWTRRALLRQTIAAGAAAELGILMQRGWTSTLPVPRHNPTAHLRLGWTNKLLWDNVINITTMSGSSWADRLEMAQSQLKAKGGGVVYFPPGRYSFTDSIYLDDGIILRGAPPNSSTDAREGSYRLSSKLEFPQFAPSLSGEGTSIDTAFKGIYLKDPASASNCGVVELSINRGHIHFAWSDGQRAGTNRIVFGCVLRNAAVAEPGVPDLSIGQKPWQRFTKWHWAAVSVKVYENALLANNRLAPSDESYLMKGYVIQARDKKVGKKEFDIWFDYDFRPGLECNDACVGAPGGNEPSGTPETHPWGFRKGIVICDNYIYSTGRNAIEFTGDGTICARNVIRFKKDVWRPTVRGFKESSGSSTTDTRPVQMRGWRWIVEDNDYEVYRNWAADHKYHINDGEGLMHENHCNAHIRDSRITGNRGNAYLSLYKTGGIDGLVIEGNDISVDRGMAIFVDADHDENRRGHCRRVSIVNNKTAGGILIRGYPAADNLVAHNNNVGEPAPLRNHANATLNNNTGYYVET